MPCVNVTCAFERPHAKSSIKPWKLVKLVFYLHCWPRREASDVWCHPPVWNLSAVIWFPFPISSLVFFCLVLLLFLSCHFSANGPFSWPFFQKTVKYFSLRVRLFCMALVEQLGDDRWSVVCADCCHMALVFAMMYLYKIFKFYIVSIHSFIIYFFNLVYIN